jgi:hypothetical protein
VFRGVTHLALDNKGRLAFPAKHRHALADDGEPKLVLTADPSHCVLVYPLSQWEPIQARLMALAVDAYGGVTGYVSNEWGGATFFIELPVAGEMKALLRATVDAGYADHDFMALFLHLRSASDQEVVR